MGELEKLRKVLDYAPASAMAGWTDREYYEALVRRLNREVLIERPLAKPARDEAVRVVPAEEWEAARAAREQQLLREAELDQTRGELDRVLAREADMRRELEDLRGRLPVMREEAEEKKKRVAQLVGVRKAAGAPPEAPPAEAAPSAEELAAEGWEVVPEAAPESLAPESFAEAAEPSEPPEDWDQELRAAEDAIRRVETEIESIESELTTLQRQEADLRKAGAPFQIDGYRLYRRSVGKRGGGQDHYFFSREAPQRGEPVPLPAGYEVGQRGRVPYLRPLASPGGKTRAARKRARRRAG